MKCLFIVWTSLYFTGIDLYSAVLFQNHSYKTQVSKYLLIIDNVPIQADVNIVKFKDQLLMSPLLAKKIQLCDNEDKCLTRMSLSL